MHKSVRERKPNSLLNNDYVFWRKRFDKPELMETVEERELKYRKFVPSLKQVTATYDKSQDSKITRRKLYHEITGKYMDSNLFKRPASASKRNMTLHQLPSSDSQVNFRFEENKNSYLNIFGYKPNSLEPQNKFGGYNKLEA